MRDSGKFNKTEYGNVVKGGKSLHRIVKGVKSGISNSKIVPKSKEKVKDFLKNERNTGAEALSTTITLGERKYKFAKGLHSIIIKKDRMKRLKKQLSIKKFTRVVPKTFVGMGYKKLKNIDDEAGTKAVDYAVKTSKYNYKGVKTASKLVKHAKRGISTSARNTLKTGIKAKNLKKNFRRNRRASVYGKKVFSAVAKNGGSVVTTAISYSIRIFKVASSKYTIPILLIIALILGVYNISSTPLKGVSALFGGIFTNKDTGKDFETHEFLKGAVVTLKNGFVEKVLKLENDNLLLNGGNYHYVRLFEENNHEELPFTRESILGTLYGDEELVSLIEPIFQNILLFEYNLEPTQSEIDKTLNEICNVLINVNLEELPIEYCNLIHSQCGNHHADISTCPNYRTGKHSSITCSTCCYRQRHRSTRYKIVDGKLKKYSRTWYSDECRGYQYCNGHRILGITVNTNGYYELLAKYFTDPIDTLANKATRTKGEEEELERLKDMYDLCLEYLKIVQEKYGDGLGTTDISNVEFIDGARPSNDKIVNIAESQLGNVGGELFWSWYGFVGRVEWCACFVSWCSNQLGYIEAGAIPKFASVRVGAKWFKDNGKWATGLYDGASGGDIIFFDWNGDKIGDHVGMVVGIDKNFVYTIEGNKGDICRRGSYPLKSNVILGYGLPNYK